MLCVIQAFHFLRISCISSYFPFWCNTVCPNQFIISRLSPRNNFLTEAFIFIFSMETWIFYLAWVHGLTPNKVSDWIALIFRQQNVLDWYSQTPSPTCRKSPAGSLNFCLEINWKSCQMNIYVRISKWKKVNMLKDINLHRWLKYDPIHGYALIDSVYK